MWKKKSFWSGELVSGNSKIEIEVHGSEGVLYYNSGTANYVMGYCNGT